MRWFLLALKNILNYKGRSRRKETGWFFLISTLISLTVSFFQEVSDSLSLQPLSNILTGISFFITMLFLFTQFALIIRRLHDLGYSGWWLLPWVGTQVILGLTEVSLASERNVELGILCTVLSTLLFFGFILWLIFKDGQRFTNKYGEDPKATSSKVAEI